MAFIGNHVAKIGKSRITLGALDPKSAAAKHKPR